MNQGSIHGGAGGKLLPQKKSSKRKREREREEVGNVYYNFGCYDNTCK